MVLANVVSPSASGRGGFSSEGLAPSHDRPGDAGHLVGQGDRDQLGRLSLLEEDPGPPIQVTVSGFGMAEKSCSAGDQKGPQIAISHLGGAAEASFSTRRVLPWNQTEEGGELSSRGKHGRIGDTGDKGCRSHGADARNAGEALADLMGPVPFQKLAIQVGDLSLQAG